ncbi:hypothetical protein LCGC14_1345680 [marine sediment metagenome]|uniref:Uncharacterized protein n=1 Tax=marine sediment metagenome TaxID=412755 RepID=A0A0F9MTA0_9ZZZZ
MAARCCPQVKAEGRNRRMGGHRAKPAAHHSKGGMTRGEPQADHAALPPAARGRLKNTSRARCERRFRKTLPGPLHYKFSFTVGSADVEASWGEGDPGGAVATSRAPGASAQRLELGQAWNQGGPWPRAGRRMGATGSAKEPQLWGEPADCGRERFVRSTSPTTLRAGGPSKSSNKGS